MFLASIASIEPLDHYCCLQLSEDDSLADLKKGFLLFKKTNIRMLDLVFSRQIQTDIDALKNMITVIPSLLETTPIEYLGLGCNNLAQVGINGLEGLLTAMPSNVKKVDLSGNGWGNLGVDPETLLKKIQVVTKISVSFDGTDEIERQLTKMQNRDAHYAMNACFRLFHTGSSLGIPEPDSTYCCTVL